MPENSYRKLFVDYIPVQKSISLLKMKCFLDKN